MSVNAENVSHLENATDSIQQLLVNDPIWIQKNYSETLDPDHKLVLHKSLSGPLVALHLSVNFHQNPFRNR